VGGHSGISAGAGQGRATRSLIPGRAVGREPRIQFMKKMFTAMALLAIIAGCMAVIFRNFQPEEDDGYVSARERTIIKKFDQDGDGILNREEQRAANAAIKAAEKQRKAYLAKYDTDGDGRLNEQERRAAGEAETANRAEIIRKFDQDGDGKLNEEEVRAARAALGR